MLLESSRVKVASKMLVKSTLDRETKVCVCVCDSVCVCLACVSECVYDFWACVLKTLSLYSVIF